MKNWIKFIFMAIGMWLLIPLQSFANDILPVVTSPFENYFVDFASVVALAALVTEAVKKWLFSNMATEWVQRVTSWVIGILIGLFAYVFNLGMFEPLLWWQALFWGFGAGLASNGLFDTGLIEWLFNLFTQKKEKYK